nr:ubiquitin carboxyl-terminal hydrolase 13 [Quercus suber]
MQIFPLGEKIENIIDHYWTIRAEEIPEEEKNLGPNDRLIHVYHFIKDRAQNPMKIENFGEPFFMVMHEGETLAEIKVRIQKKLQVPDEEFAKWKFAFLSQGRPEYLQDSDIVSSHFQLEHDNGKAVKATLIRNQVKLALRCLLGDMSNSKVPGA